MCHGILKVCHDGKLYFSSIFIKILNIFTWKLTMKIDFLNIDYFSILRESNVDLMARQSSRDVLTPSNYYYLYLGFY